MSDASAWIGYGPKILVALQDANGLTKVYTGIVREGHISITHPMDDITMSEDINPVGQVRSGPSTVNLEVEFFLQYSGGQMKTWADIKKPEEINATQLAIESDPTI